MCLASSSITDILLSLTVLALRFCTMFYLFIISWLWLNLTWLITWFFFFSSGIFLDASSPFTNCFKVPQMFLKVLLLSLLMVFLLVCFWNLFLSYLPAPQMAPCLILNLLFFPPFFRNSLSFIASLITVLACLHSCSSQPSLLPSLLTVLPGLLIPLRSIKCFSNVLGCWLFSLFIYFYFQLSWPCLTAPLTCLVCFLCWGKRWADSVLAVRRDTLGDSFQGHQANQFPGILSDSLESESPWSPDGPPTS